MTPMADRVRGLGVTNVLQISVLRRLFTIIVLDSVELVTYRTGQASRFGRIWRIWPYMAVYGARNFHLQLVLCFVPSAAKKPSSNLLVLHKRRSSAGFQTEPENKRMTSHHVKAKNAHLLEELLNYGL